MEEQWEIEGLAANGPNPELSEKLKLFGQFVGDWEIFEDRIFQEDGSEKVLTGDLHWRWILEGRAVQDVWRFFESDSKKFVSAGTTVRFYDPKIDAWHSVWCTPLGNAVIQFVGKKSGDEILLEGKDPENGDSLKWIFYEIKPESFVWREERLSSKNASPNWKLTERMLIRRE
jgi:hypothetical protein